MELDLVLSFLVPIDIGDDFLGFLSVTVKASCGDDCDRNEL